MRALSLILIAVLLPAALLSSLPTASACVPYQTGSTADEYSVTFNLGGEQATVGVLVTQNQYDGTGLCGPLAPIKTVSSTRVTPIVSLPVQA